jgi:hypothetical protein
MCTDHVSRVNQSMCSLLICKVTSINTVHTMLWKNPGVYRGSKDIDIAIIWPNCFYVAIFERKKSQLLSWLKKNLFWMILIL